MCTRVHDKLVFLCEPRFVCIVGVVCLFCVLWLMSVCVCVFRFCCVFVGLGLNMSVFCVFKGPICVYLGVYKGSICVPFVCTCVCGCACATSLTRLRDQINK